jgi:hypothetical protein
LPFVSLCNGDIFIPARDKLMTASTPFRRAALTLAAVGAFAIPAIAMAQPYDTRQDADQAQYQADRARQDQARRDYDAQYGPGSYDRYYSAGVQDDREARHECHQEKKGNEVGGALLGGIAGAVIGSNVARGGGREGGAIIGGVGGAALGSNIAKNSTHCD